MKGLRVKEDFISSEVRNFKWHLGKTIASSLSGFIVGIIVASIIFFTFFDFALKQ